MSGPSTGQHVPTPSEFLRAEEERVAKIYDLRREDGICEALIGVLALVADMKEEREIIDCTSLASSSGVNRVEFIANLEVRLTKFRFRPVSNSEDKLKFIVTRVQDPVSATPAPAPTLGLDDMELKLQELRAMNLEWRPLCGTYYAEVPKANVQYSLALVSDDHVRYVRIRKMSRTVLWKFPLLSVEWRRYTNVGDGEAEFSSIAKSLDIDVMAE